MSDTIDIAICMGSSCFARGNNVRLEALEDLVRARSWEGRVILSGLRCENRCSAGPNLKIDGELYQDLDVETLIDIVEAKLEGKPAAGTGVCMKTRDG